MKFKMIVILVMMLSTALAADNSRFGSFRIADSSSSIIVSPSTISFIYRSVPVAGSRSSSVTRIDIVLESPDMISYEQKELNLPFNPIQKKILPICTKFEMVDEGKSFSFKNSSVINIDMSSDNLCTIKGAFAMVLKDEKFYFLADDVLYPAPVSFHVRGSEFPSLNIPLIKPEVNQRWATFYGGSVYDDLTSVVSAGGLVYVCGSTQSNDLPVTPGTFQDTLGGYYDAILSCYTRSGVQKWSTYFGGSGLDIATSICADINGGCYVAGYTNSPDFPLVNSTQPINGSYDGFVLKFDSTGVPLYSGFFGGTGGDFIYSIAADKYGNIFFGGGTTSQDLPVSALSAQPVHGGSIDAFVARINNNYQFDWCSYLGGAGSEDMHAMTTDLAGAVIFCGGSYSPDFPTVNPFQQFPAGSADVYVCKMDSVGSIVFSTFYGGTGNDDAYGIVTDSSNSIYVTGFTPGNDLLISSNAYQQSNRGGFDSFLIKLTGTGSFSKGTYFGGTSDDQAAALAFGDGKVYLAGSTFSVDLPVDSTAIQQLSAGGYDSFYAVFDTTLNLLNASYYGGIGSETTLSISYDSVYTFYLAGKTTSDDLPFTGFGPQDSLHGGEDGFLARINYKAVPNVTRKQLNEASTTLYPVPARDVLHIVSGAFQHYELISSTGMIISSGRLDHGRSSLDVSPLSQGIYAIRLHDNNNSVISRKFVKL